MTARALRGKDRHSRDYHHTHSLYLHLTKSYQYHTLQNRLVTIVRANQNKMRFSLATTLLVAAGFQGYALASPVKGEVKSAEAHEDAEFWERFLGNYKKHQPEPEMSLSPKPTP
jgi:hypothetical protein